MVEQATQNRNLRTPYRSGVCHKYQGLNMQHIKFYFEQEVWYRQASQSHPDIRDKPPQDPSPEVKQILLEQFDTKDIEQAWIPAFPKFYFEQEFWYRQAGQSSGYQGQTPTRSFARR